MPHRLPGARPQPDSHGVARRWPNWRRRSGTAATSIFRRRAFRSRTCTRGRERSTSSPARWRCRSTSGSRPNRPWKPSRRACTRCSTGTGSSTTCVDASPACPFMTPKGQAGRGARRSDHRRDGPDADAVHERRHIRWPLPRRPSLEKSSEFGPPSEGMHGVDERVRLADIGPLSIIYERTIAALLVG